MKSAAKSLLFLSATAAMSMLPLAGATRTWTGGGGDAKASTAANWGGTAPVAGDDVVFDSGSANCTWDLDVKLGSWTQDGYTGTVTIGTVYDSAGFDCLEIEGDCIVRTGTWTHQRNTALNRTYRLYVSVGGDLEVGSAATIQATGLGYERQYLLNGGKNCTDWYRGGTYGGYGCWNGSSYHPTVYGTVPYGSITAPEDPGSGTSGSANYAGGGAIRLDVAGAVTHNGVISANGKPAAYYMGSGGSVYIRAGSISGSGTLEANSRGTSTSGDYSSGSGGRISVVLTGEGSDFSAYDALNLCSARTVLAHGNAQTRSGAPGTIYLEKPADGAGRGWLIFKDGGNYSHDDRGLCNGWMFDGNQTESARFSKVTVTNGASVVAMPGYRIDLSQADFVTAGSAKVSNGMRLEGGEVEFASAKPAIDWWLCSSAGGLDGLQGTDFTLSSPGRIDFNTEDATLPGNWTIGAGVTVAAGAAKAGAKSITLACTGDLTLNGSITHPGSYPSDPVYLKLVVGGDFTLGSTGIVDMKGNGYAATRCPTGAIGQTSGASHGGWGLLWAATETCGPIVPYGSIYYPTTAGSGGYNASSGGGAVVIEVGGRLTNNGTIRTLGTTNDGTYRATAGSVNITADSIAGAGSITADASEKVDHSPAGGGRVAIRLTGSGATFADYTGRISAAGEYASLDNGKIGGAGTVYLRTAAQTQAEGTLVVQNFDTTHSLAQWGWTIVGGGVEGDSFGDVYIGNKARLVVYGDATLNVGGVLSNGCKFVAQTGSTVNFTGEGESRVYGDFDFCNLTASTPGKTITFDDGATISVAGEASVTGSSDAPVTLASATEGQAWTLRGANVSLNGVALRDCRSESAITVVNGTDLGGNSANVSFVSVQPGETLTWDGSEDTAWGNAANWDANRAPIATDLVVIPSGCANQPALGADATVAGLTLAAGATLTVGSRTLTVNGAVSAAGTVAASGGKLVASGDVALAGAGVRKLSLTLAGETDQAAAFTGTRLKTLEIANDGVSVSGTLDCETFTAGDGITAREIAFAAGSSVAADNFIFLGDATAKDSVLRCSDASGKWYLNASVAEVTGATVSGSDASAGVLIVPTACNDGGNNVNWMFNDTRAHWLGTTGDFATPGNWSTGAVPDSGTDVVIDSVKPVTVSAAAAVKSLALSAGATMTVNAEFAVAGSVSVADGAKLAWNRPGTVGGNLVLLSGAVLTHSANTTTEANKLDLAVGGSMTVAAGAKVDAKGMGYAKGKGPGSRNGSSGPASHGGRGGANWYSYGSVLCPTNCGSGGCFSSGYTYAGGGAVKLAVTGALTVNGTIDASAPMADYYTGSGGSVWLSASAITGAGSILANGGNGTTRYFGAGGRIALYETVATDFSDFTGAVEAYSGSICNSSDVVTGNADNSPGTIYRETAAQSGGFGRVTVASRPNATKPADANYMTDLPAAKFAVTNELRNADIDIGYYGVLSLTGDLKARDVKISSAVIYNQCNLMLNGHVLKLKVKEHQIGSNDAKQVSYGTGGEIKWLPPWFILYFR